MGVGLGLEERTEKGWVCGQTEKMTSHKSRNSDSGSCERKELNNLISFAFSWFVLMEWTEVAQKSYNKMTRRYQLRKPEKHLGVRGNVHAELSQPSHSNTAITSY